MKKKKCITKDIPHYMRYQSKMIIITMVLNMKTKKRLCVSNIYEIITFR